MIINAVHARWLRIITAVFGAFISACVINILIVPHSLYNGGLLGLCQVIRTVLLDRAGISFSGMDIAGILYMLANVPLLILAWKSFGREFVIKLIICTVSCSAFLTVIPVPNTPVIKDMLTSCLIAGIINGFANGLMLTCGSCGGGMDVLWLYLSKKKKATVGKLGIIFNVALFFMCFLIFDTNTAVYSAIYAVMTAVFIDRLHMQNILVQVIIITKEKNPELPKYIMETLGRGVTYWNGRGAYTGDDVQVLCVVLSKFEIDLMQRAVRELDPQAFFIEQDGVHVFGNFARRFT